MACPPPIDLRERLTGQSGAWYLPGMQAIARLPIEQAGIDRAAGRRMGTLVTGYPGSPLAGLDLQLALNGKLLAERDIRHIPAGNEEQAATALMGSQMLDRYPHERYEGVTGFWYGKGPGVDRAGDAIKHGNFAGTSRAGSVVLLSGEDHEAKSSTMPFQQEYAFMSAGVPILYPGSVADIRRLGLHAVALSRFSGCWVALKLVSQICDGGETVDLSAGFTAAVPELEVGGRPFAKRADFSFFPGKNIDHERHLYEERHPAAIAYARANGLDRILADGGSRPRLGIVTAGKSRTDLIEALRALGAPPQRLADLGIRVLDVAMVYPLDGERVREFAAGLDRVIVVEEKREVLESAVRAALQPLGAQIEVIGKHDADGRVVLPVQGGMDADLIAQRLHPYLTGRVPELVEPPRLAELAAIRDRAYATTASRTPNFCSGCPHSASTVLAEGQMAWGAPGCNCFNEVIEQPKRHIDTMTQYGGEGLPWIGLEPFTEREHVIQHVGDGSIYHSSYLNVRFAVAAGARITFKVLYNGAVANTGAQSAVGARGVAELVRGLCAEGVERIAILSKEPRRYRGERFDSRVEVRPASELTAVSVELEAVDGVTVLLYDESCANERRRQQRRGKLPTPRRQVLINTAVCENCGDCGAKSNCMSLQKVETEFGPKTQIHQSSCNFDYSCLQGDCPSFLTVELGERASRRRPQAPEIDPASLPPAPRRRLDRPLSLYMPGVGGTGVITINAIVAVAAQIDGIACVSYDQTGAAQKWGPVLSSLTLFPPGAPAGSNKVGLGQADLLLAFDDVSAASAPNLDRCDPERTGLVLNTDLFPTGEMVRDVWQDLDQAKLRVAIRDWTNPRRRVEIPARTLAEQLFGDYMLTNMIALGAALQAGELPISAAALEAAIEVNGVAVETNAKALLVGRQWVADPAPLLARIAPQQTTAEEEIARRRGSLSGARRGAFDEMAARTDGLDPALRRSLAVRFAELLDYQSPAYARRYLDRVLRVAAAERSVATAEGQLAAAVADGLYKLMAYKDEYEVARLHLHGDFERQLRDQFEGKVKVVYNFHPPFMRRLGRRDKVAFGPWFRPALRLLRAARRLRGTRLDPFAAQRSRREERELVAWYEGLIEEILAELRPATLAIATELAQLPAGIRGYEEVKERNGERVKLRSQSLLRRLHRPAGQEPLPVVRRQSS